MSPPSPASRWWRRAPAARRDGAAATDLARRGRERLFVPFSVGLGVLAALAVLEIAVRIVFPYSTPDTVRASSLQYVPSVFSRHRLEPAQVVHLEDRPGDDGGAPTARTYDINEAGYRGPAIRVPKPAGVRRIVILGGSSVFDTEADEGRDWPRLVEGRLRGAGHPEVEVINAGVPGHATFDAVGRLASQIWMVEPDYVLLYDTWNDLKSLPDVTTARPLLYLIRPYDSRDDLSISYAGTIDRWLCASQLYVQLRRRYVHYTRPRGPEGALPERDGARAPTEAGLRQYRLDVELFVDAARAAGAVPILVTEGTLVAAGNDETTRRRINYRYQGMDHDTLVKAFDDCYRILREVARDRKVLLVDTTERLRGRPELFVDQVHTTPRGSEILAETVADALRGVLDRGDR